MKKNKTMKATRIYFLLVLLLMAGGVTMQAQEYLPIAQKGNEWHTFETSVWQINNYVNWCSGDTLIEDVRYMKIMGTVNDSYPIFYTLLREEEGKVWKRYSIAHSETLLYDFTASVGDTLRIGDFAEEMVLDSISVVQIGDVDRRKFWFGLEYDGLGNPRAKETWVEGIGSDYGLLWTGYFNVFDGWHCLLCFHQNGELVWQNPEYNTCTYPYDAVEENKDSEIALYPNPVRDRVVIEGIEIAEVEVYNALGQRVKMVQSTNEINVSGLPEGVYLLFITDAKGISQTKRITVVK
jgi:hypothetical protein